MKNTIRSMITLLLAVLLLCSLSVGALAENTKAIYPDGQSYKEGEGDTQFYTVQVSAGPNLDGAERTRTQLINAGFDCFVYEVDGGYRIMCGKFPSAYDAMLYRDLIREATKRDNAYVTDVKLPDSAREDFLKVYKQDPLVVGKAMYNGWEDPTGKFVDMTANEEETALIYVVQYSCGGNFKAAEQRRDELTEKGYDGYVVKVPCFYHIVAGAFDNWNDALALCLEIRQATGNSGCSVQRLSLPASLLG